MPRLSAILMRASQRTTQQLVGAQDPMREGSRLLYCIYCMRPVLSETARSRHVAATPSCQAAEEAALHRARTAPAATQDSGEFPGPIELDEPGSRESTPEPMLEPVSREPTPEPTVKPAVRDLTPEPMADATTPTPVHPSPRSHPGTPDEPPLTTTNNKVRPFVEEFPILSAGKPISPDYAVEPNMDAYIDWSGSLGDPEDFEVAELLMTTGLTDAAKDKHLKSTKYRGKTPWPNVSAMLTDIDRLPHGPDWQIHEFSIDNGQRPRTQYLFARDVVDVVRDLLGNPRFKDHMHYAPERHWTSDAHETRMYSEMWTGDWWWRTQHMLPDKLATIVGIILASDKTTLSVMCGGQEAYPVYATIGNISKDIRRKPSEHATVLLGYLPVDHFEDIADDNRRQRLKGELIHRSMDILLKPLRKALEKGVDMWCADGRLRRVYPVVAAYVADWPEQNLMACTSQGSCPVCNAEYKGRGDYNRSAPVRQRDETLDALRAYFEHDDPGELKGLHLKPWWPWWASVPYVNISACITPDLLHQLYQGIVKTHLLAWMKFLVGEKELDNRFASMPGAEGLRTFSRGVSVISQWTGRESKELVKQLLPAVVGAVTPEVSKMVCSILDFIYRAHASSLDEDDIEDMNDSLEDFHRLKGVMVNLGYFESSERFDKIPKLHMLSHYTHSIRELGTPDGYNTEAPEHLHIEYAKAPWRASNKVRPLPQMVVFIQRLEAIRLQRVCIDAHYGLTQDLKEAEDEDEGVGEGEGMVEGNEVEVEVERRVEGGVGGMSGGVAADSVREDGDETVYPSPVVHTAKRPTQPKLRGRDLADSYGATDLIPALTECLVSRFEVPKTDILISPNHRFDVWHRVYLHQRALPFAPGEPPRRDALRAIPPAHDARGRVRRAGVFDTALFLQEPSQPERSRQPRPAKFGIQRYRAARIRAFFTLPQHLQHVFSGQLAYLELFTLFQPSVSPFHRMHVSALDSQPNGRRRTLVIPVSDLALACHVAPQFRRLGSELALAAKLDLLSIGRQFFLNHYHNHFVFLLINHWRRQRLKA